MEGDTITFKSDGQQYKTSKVNVTKNPHKAGANPFVEEKVKVQSYQTDIDGLVHRCELAEQRRNNHYESNGVIVKEVNWEPFVITKENKYYYQRPFVWTLENNQLLISSIYLGIDCGRILLRNRSFKEIDALTKDGETEVCFKDVVDGKQRLNAIRGFINDEFPDSYGNFYSDLSDDAQMKFRNAQCFSYGELPENTPDEVVIEQFLKVNFSGVPQSEEHINYVRNILNMF
jgi:hypothetical protein